MPVRAERRPLPPRLPLRSVGDDTITAGVAKGPMIGGAGDDVLTVTVAKGAAIFGDSGTNPDYNGRTKESDEDYLRQRGSRHEGWIIEYSYSYTEDRDYAPSDGADRIDMQLFQIPPRALGPRRPRRPPGPVAHDRAAVDGRRRRQGCGRRNECSQTLDINEYPEIGVQIS